MWKVLCQTKLARQRKTDMAWYHLFVESKKYFFKSQTYRNRECKRGFESRNGGGNRESLLKR